MDIYWEIVTKSGLILNEKNNKIPDLKDIKSFYLRYKNNYYGIHDNLTFFVNNQIYDLKLHQKITNYFQFKQVEYDLFTNKHIVSHNIGVNTEDNNQSYKYIISVSKQEQLLKCYRGEEERIINLGR